MIQCHKEIRDAISHLVSFAYKKVIQEPVEQEVIYAYGVPSLITDLSIGEVWQPHTVALFETCFVDTDAPSYPQRDVPLFYH